MRPHLGQRILLLLMVGFFPAACVKNFDAFGLRELGLLAVLRPGNAFRFSNFPAQLTIPIPQTLSAQTLATTTGLTRFQVATCSSQSFGYQEIRELVDNFRQITKDAQRELMILDGLVPQARSKPHGTCIEGGTFTIEWTAEMREGVFSSIQDAGLSASLAETLVLQLEQERYIPRVGEVIPSPVMEYTTNQNGYDYQLRYAFSPDGMTVPYSCADVAGDFDSIMRWDESRMKYQLGYQEFYDDETFSGILTLNLATETMFFRETYDTNGDSYSRTTGMKVCGGPRCVLLNMTEFYTSGGVDEIYRIDGKADDNGGYVRTAYTYNDGADTDYYREYFAEGGTVLGMLESDDDITYTEVSGCEDFDYDSEPYDDGGIVSVGLDIDSGAVLCTGAAVDCQFVIVPDGVDPNLNPETIIGSGGQINSVAYFDYWGDADSELTDADIWDLTGFDADGEPIYANMIDGMLTEI